MLRKNNEIYDPICSINVTPFVDVLLVLLVIFMITAPLLTRTIEVQLPRENVRSANSQDSRRFVVTIDRKGKYYIEGKRHSQRKLLIAADHWRERKKGDVAFIRADKKVDYGKVTALMAILKNADIQNIGLLVENKKR